MFSRKKLLSRMGGVVHSLLVLTLLCFLFYETSFGQEQMKEDVVKVEDKIVAEINKDGAGSRFLIKEITPKKNKLVCRVTMKPLPLGENRFSASVIDLAADKEGRLAGTWVKGPTIGPGFLIDTEFPEDMYCISAGSKGLGGVHLKGKGSIHRFDGIVKMDGYTFIGEEGKTNRLTFAVLDMGYIYLRGKGKVVFPDGKKVQLGY